MYVHVRSLDGVDFDWLKLATVAKKDEKKNIGEQMHYTSVKNRKQKCIALLFFKMSKGLCISFQ